MTFNIKNRRILQAPSEMINNNVSAASERPHLFFALTKYVMLIICFGWGQATKANEIRWCMTEASDYCFSVWTFSGEFLSAGFSVDPVLSSNLWWAALILFQSQTWSHHDIFNRLWNRFTSKTFFFAHCSLGPVKQYNTIPIIPPPLLDECLDWVWWTSFLVFFPHFFYFIPNHWD